MDYPINTFNLTRKYGENVAVENLNIKIEKGEILGLLGPNGAGKTTTIRMLTGMIKPTSGYAEVMGMRTDERVEDVHRVVGLLTENPGFYERLSVWENLIYFARFYAIDAWAQVEKYLRVVGLWEKREQKVGTFSRGMKQRLAIARALVHDPSVVFLDEPTSGLDPEIAGEIRELIKKMKDQGKTIFLSTHNLHEAEALCDRIGILHNRLLLLDTVENLKKRFSGHEVTVEIDGAHSEIVEKVKALPFVKEVFQKNNNLTVGILNPDENKPELVKYLVENGVKVLGVYEKHRSLEDIYPKLVKKK